METLELELARDLRSFRLEVALEVGGGTVALVGPSGAGKSTVLRAIAGLDRTEGRVALGRDVWLDSAHGVDLPPERRSVGLVFQDYALFPHLSVRKNVSFGGAAGVDELLERFSISHLVEARPGELSGGERQRVALARALARGPRVLLLGAEDEGHGRVALAVYPWEISLARIAARDSAVNHVHAPIASLVRLGNRVRVRVGPLTAEVTAASADRLGLEVGEIAVASFKATGARLVRAG